MAEVTGRIGSEEVELNNAATEATLRLLLQSSLATTKEQKAAIASLAQKAGLDPAAVAAANAELAKNTPAMSALGKAAYGAGIAFGSVKPALDTFVNFAATMAQGEGNASDLFGALGKLPFGLGQVATGFQKLAVFQEGMLKQYQGMTNAGVNFGGSLTELRMAASNTYMTMEEFGRIVKNNGPTFAKMGGTVDEGARAWAKASNTLLKSDAGTNLRALGFTTEQVNQGMLDYISVTGGRSKKELQNTDALAKSSALYMEELDQLASITGKSREEIAKKAKAEMEAADFQLFLAGKSVKEREVIEANVKRAGALYGQGGMDIAKANAMGVAVQGEAGKKLTAVSNATSDGIKKDLDIRKKYGNDSTLLNKNEIETRQATSNNLMKLSGGVASYGGAIKGIEDAALLAAKDKIAGEKGVEEQYTKATAEKIARENSQAKQAVETQKALQEFGQTVLNAVLPIVDFFLPALNGIVKFLGEFKYVTIGLIAAFVTYKGAMLAKSAVGALGGMFSGGAGAAGALTGGAAGPAGAVGSMGGLAEGLGKVGPAMGSIGKGAGDLIKSFMQGAASGLKAFANPQVLLGAAGFGIAIAAIGAGIAAASWIMGKALPTLAEGLGKIGELDGARLGSVAMGVGKLGLGLLAFGPFALFGLPAGLALNMLADGIVKLNSVDPIKLERVAAAMQKVKDATPSIGQSIAAGVSGLVSKVTGVTETPAAEGKTAATAPAGGGNNIEAELKLLNKQTAEMIKYIKESTDHARQNVSATKSLSSDFFKF